MFHGGLRPDRHSLPRYGDGGKMSPTAFRCLLAAAERERGFLIFWDLNRKTLLIRHNLEGRRDFIKSRSSYGSPEGHSGTFGKGSHYALEWLRVQHQNHAHRTSLVKHTSRVQWPIASHCAHDTGQGGQMRHASHKPNHSYFEAY